MKKVIGIDLGGTEIIGGLFDGDGNIYKKSNRLSGAEVGKKLVLERIREIIDELIDEDVKGIGIGIPGFIDIEKKMILSLAVNIKDWPYTKVEEELKKYYDIPIYIENDANVATLGEAWIGAGKNLNSIVMVTLGTGVGSGVYYKEKGLLYGNNYEGPELGHTILYPNGRQCSCGQKGCAEKYISGTALEINYEELTGKKLKGKEIFNIYEEDENARKTIEKFIEDLGVLLITIKNTFDPEGIIIGGGVINSKEYWLEKVKKYYIDNCNSPKNIEILPAKYLNDAGMIGAAKIAFSKI